MTELKEMVPNYSIGDHEYESTLDEDIHIDRSNLQDEFVAHAGRFGFWATAHELAVDRLNRLKSELERQYAMLDIEKRTELLNAGMKVTEKMVENSVILAPEYIAILDQLHEAEKSAGLLRAARDAMMARKDMLVQLGSTARAEFNADISLLERERRDRK